jgi:hypothetical protein
MEKRKEDGQQMTFEQWLQRPVYMIQCFTFHIAKQVHQGDLWLYFRAIPKARRGGSGAWRAQGQAWRNRTATRLRELRQGGLQRQDVRCWFNQHVRNKQGGGTAVQCDLEGLLSILPESAHAFPGS